MTVAGAGPTAAGAPGADGGGATYVKDGDTWALGIVGGSIYDMEVDSQGNIGKAEKRQAIEKATENRVFF